MRRNIFERACLEEQHRREHEKRFGCPYNCDFDHGGSYHRDIEYLSPGKKIIVILGASILAMIAIAWGMTEINKVDIAFNKMKEETIKEMQDMNFQLNPNRVKSTEVKEKAMEEKEIEKE